MNKNKVDIEKLKKEHPNDPHTGQGFNDARGEVEADEPNPLYKNKLNNLGPEQKRHKDRPAA